MWRSALLLVLSGCRSLLGFEEAVLVGDAAPGDTQSPDADAAPDAPLDGNALEEELVVAAVADASTNATQPNLNNGDSETLTVDGTPERTILLRFDLSTIPTTAVVTLAELQVTTSNDATQNNELYRMLVPWIENQATHLRATNNMLWPAEGANPPSRDTVPCGMEDLSLANNPFTISMTIGVVQDWVTTPTSNHGLALTTINDNGGTVHSRESKDPQRPMLRVKFIR